MKPRPDPAAREARESPGLAIPRPDCRPITAFAFRRLCAWQKYEGSIVPDLANGKPLQK